MDIHTVFKDAPISGGQVVSDLFLSLNISTFQDACRYVQALDYGYNSDRDEHLVLFKEKKGTCTTKHAMIAELAAELKLPVVKYIGIYAMTEELVTGTQQILTRFDLPCLPMIHCFLSDGKNQVDLTIGNCNGKNRPIHDFLHTEKVAANITAKQEYLIYRNALQSQILKLPAFNGVELIRVLRAREQGLSLLKAGLADCG